MSHAPKNKPFYPTPLAWQPSASIETLKARAHILKTLRDFFYARGILEVETPLMGHTSVSDPYIHSIPVYFQPHLKAKAKRYYLQTSPEYAMKRLLAAGHGPIFQISKAFRQGEVGPKHNPEFTMLEWYRPGFNHHDLMDEMDELLQLILHKPAAERISYAALFQTHFGFDPHLALVPDLIDCAKQHHISPQNAFADKDTWLTLLMSHHIEPLLGKDRPVFVYDFPASQSALARLQPTDPPVASRFEVYFKGIELANGFHELQNVAEQRLRFEKNLATRHVEGFEPIPIDELFLAALAHGLPDCSGVALGIDRLVMLATDSPEIADVLSFNFSRV